MKHIETILKEHWQKPFNNLLFIGEKPHDFMTQLNTQADFSQGGYWDHHHDLSLADFVDQEDFYVGQMIGCLIVIIDGGNATLSECIRSLKKLRDLRDPSPQLAFIILTENEGLITYDQFAEGVSADLLDAGDRTHCTKTLELWLKESGDTSTWPHFGSRFPKKPSLWLREIYHDYFSNGVKMHRDKLEGSKLWEIQKDIDFRQNALRSIFLNPNQNRNARAIVARTRDAEPLIYRNTYDPLRPCPLIIPDSLGNELARAEFELDEDYRCYSNKRQMVDLLDSARAAGDDFVLVLEADKTPPDPIINGEGSVPLVLIGEKPPTFTLSQWRSFFSNHGVGAFSRVNFARVAVEKKDSWRAFCRQSPLQCVDSLIHQMAKTHEILPDYLEDEELKTLQEKIFHSLAGIWSARGLYFGRSIQFPCLDFQQ